MPGVIVLSWSPLRPPGQEVGGGGFSAASSRADVAASCTGADTWSREAMSASTSAREPRTASRSVRARAPRVSSGAAASSPVNRSSTAPTRAALTCQPPARASGVVGLLQLGQQLAGEPGHLGLRGRRLGVPGAAPAGAHQEEAGEPGQQGREHPPQPARDAAGLPLDRLRAPP